VAIATPTYQTEIASATNNHTSVTTPSFTCPTGIVFAAGVYREAEDTITMSETGWTRSGSWTVIYGGYESGTLNEAWLAWAICSGSASGTVTATFATRSDRTAMHIFTIASGYNTGDPINESNEAVSSGASDDLNISAPGSLDTADSLVISIVGSRGGQNAPGGSETPIRETDTGGTSNSYIDSMYKVNDGSHVWSTTRGGGAANHSGVLVEVKAAAAAGFAYGQSAIIGGLLVSLAPAWEKVGGLFRMKNQIRMRTA